MKFFVWKRTKSLNHVSSALSRSVLIYCATCSRNKASKPHSLISTSYSKQEMFSKNNKYLSQYWLFKRRFFRDSKHVSILYWNNFLEVHQTQHTEWIHYFISLNSNKHWDYYSQYILWGGLKHLFLLWWWWKWKKGKECFVE